MQDWLLANFTHHSEFVFSKTLLSVIISTLGYSNLVMSYIPLLRSSREIVLLALPTLLYTCYSISYRLIVHSTVYYDYDNSSILLSDNICTLSSFEFYLFSKYITILRKQPSKRIRLADYLSDSSMSHGIAIMHMVNNWYWTVFRYSSNETFQWHILLILLILLRHMGLAISDCAFHSG